MKRVIALLLLLALVLSICACAEEETPTQTGSQTEPVQSDATEPDTTREPWPEELYQVTKPMKYPVYTYDHEPTTDELRQTAVQAMRDMLSIQWSTPTYFAYQKTGAVSGKKFSHVPGYTYCGLPYTNGDSAIYSWYEFYDQETGMLYFDGDGMELNKILGNTCTGSIMWGWATVCDGLTGIYDNFHMTPMWGCYPVGNYKTQYGIDTFAQYSTAQIIDDNGDTVMLECYAQMLPADAVASYPQDHGMMIIEAPVVVRNSDGSINAEESYVMIQDQRAGTGQLFYQVEEDGEMHYYSGRTSYKYTFARLLGEDYIPVTAAEFMGTDPYKPPTVEHKPAVEEVKTLDDLLSGTLECNFPMVIIKLIATDENGEDIMIHRVFLDKVDNRNGLCRKFNLSDIKYELQNTNYNGLLESGKTYTFRYDITVSNGEIYSPSQVTATFN